MVDRNFRQVDKNRWEPVLEDARFQKESLVSGMYVYVLESDDFNTDGRTDFVYTGNDRPKLTGRYQGEEHT